MATRKWANFKAAEPHFEYAGAALRKAWPRLHRGDLEPFPKGAQSAAAQDAWRAFHAGRFQEAVEAGAALGAAGPAPAAAGAARAGAGVERRTPAAGGEQHEEGRERQPEAADEEVVSTSKQHDKHLRAA